MRSGILGPSDGKFWHAALSGDWWSSRGADKRYDGAAVLSAYYLNFTTAVHSSNGPDARFVAFPLRCLSTVLDM